MAAHLAWLAALSCGSPSLAEPPPGLALVIEAAIPATASPIAPPVPTPAEAAVVAITLVGDTGFGGDRQPVRGGGAVRHGAIIPWADFFKGIRGHVAGDLAFANLETVVTLRGDLVSEDKIFAFRSHPEGIEQLAGLGFNLISTANNHSMDYGQAGALDTLAALDDLAARGRIKAHAGLAATRMAALEPRTVEVKGSRVLFGAIGIVSGGFAHHRVGAARPGQLAYQSMEDFDDLTGALAAADGDFRILSVHHGQERVVHTSQEAIHKLRTRALLGKGIDLIVGHHSHVAAGAEITDGRVILYGLGNFLHPGMQSSAGLGLCKDFGLMARVHLLRESGGRLVVRAVEAIPLQDMHVGTRPMSPAAAADRIQVLNHLAGFLDDAASGARGMRFSPRADGTGVHCVAGAADDPAPIGPMCRGLEPAVPPSGALRARIVAACAGGAPPLVASSTPPAAKASGTPVRLSSGNHGAATNPFAGN